MLPVGRTFNKSKNVFSNSNYGNDFALSAMRLFAESGQVRARSLYFPPVKQLRWIFVNMQELNYKHKLSLVH